MAKKKKATKRSKKRPAVKDLSAKSASSVKGGASEQLDPGKVFKVVIR